MGLFDIFTGNAAKKAAEQTQQYLTGVQNTGNAGIDQALAQSLGYLQSGVGTAKNDINAGFAGATGAVNTGANNAYGYLDQGQGAAQGYLGQGLGQYDALAGLGQKYGGATNLALDSYGVNGAAGNQRAVDAFHAGPGYNFQLDQGLEAINRRRNMGGMLNSGNADRDATTYGQGLANQAYGGWQSGLQGFVNPELAATQGAAAGRAGINTAQAGLANAGGTARAGVATGAGNTLAGLLAGQGTALGGLATGQGQGLASLTQGAEGQKLGLAQGVMQPYTNSIGQAAAAQQQGSANLWSLGLNGLAALAGKPSSLGSLPNMPSIFGSFGLPGGAR